MTTWKPNFFPILGFLENAMVHFWGMGIMQSTALVSGNYCPAQDFDWRKVTSHRIPWSGGCWWCCDISMLHPKTMYSAKWGPRMGKRRKFILYIHNILRYIQLPLQKCYRTWLDMVTAFVQNVQKKLRRVWENNWVKTQDSQTTPSQDREVQLHK